MMILSMAIVLTVSASQRLIHAAVCDPFWYTISRHNQLGEYVGIWLANGYEGNDELLLLTSFDFPSSSVFCSIVLARNSATYGLPDYHVEALTSMFTPGTVLNGQFANILHQSLIFSTKSWTSNLLYGTFSTCSPLFRRINQCWSSHSSTSMICLIHNRTAKTSVKFDECKPCHICPQILFFPII